MKTKPIMRVQLVLRNLMGKRVPFSVAKQLFDSDLASIRYLETGTISDVLWLLPTGWSVTATLVSTHE